MSVTGTGKIILSDNLPVLREMPSESVRLIYIDPPFNTGRRQTRRQLRTVADPEGGDRVGFQGKRYRRSGWARCRSPTSSTTSWPSSSPG